MNETECDNLIKSVKWTEPSSLISLAILEFINVLVIGGNLLVIAAVFCSNKLRSVTNFFIVNLAVADLLVGLAVLPFSATWEVFKVWIFGDVWCRIWLAVDVWMCTASILNLCAISLDRYVAVTRPVTYPSIMSTKKAKSLIAGIWVLSFVICFPPLVGWKDQKPMIQPTYARGNYTLYNATSTTAISTESPETTATTIAAATAPPLSSSSSSSSSLSSSTIVASSIEAIETLAAPASLKHKENRQKPFEMTKTTTTNAHYSMPPLPVSAAKALSHSRKVSFKSTSSSYKASSLYNSVNPYDPYYAHLKNHNTGNKNFNNQFVVDTDSAAEVTLQNNNSPADINDINSNSNNNIMNYNNNNNENDDAETHNTPVAINDEYDNDDDRDSEYIAKASESSESTSIRYNNDPTAALSYDTADKGHQMKSIDSTATTASTTSASSSPASSSSSSFSYATPAPPCPWKCELTNDRGYVLYSALGSFYIPMFVMLFFYWRIYRAAVRTTRAINQGFKTTKGSPHEPGTNRVDETQLVLRIHRGRPCTTPQRTPLSVHSMSSTLSVNSNNDDMYPLQHHLQLGQHQGTIPKRATSMKVPRTKHEKVSIKVSFPSSENMLDSTTSINSTPPAYASVVSSATVAGGQQTASGSLINGRRSSFKSSLFEIGETTFNVDTSNNMGNSMASHPNKMIEVHTDSLLKKNDKKQRSKRSVKFQVKRFKVETKAAKTLAIIVGGFIFCWLPFFTMYLIRAFCDHCIQPTVFSVLFWLGYCNSAINPLIYALFSHEFRIAFKRIVCRCVCTRSGFRASENFQMIAARALMAPATFHKTISGCSDEGDGPEFS